MPAWTALSDRRPDNTVTSLHIKICESANDLLAICTVALWMHTAFYSKVSTEKPMGNTGGSRQHKTLLKEGLL